MSGIRTRTALRGVTPDRACPLKEMAAPTTPGGVQRRGVDWVWVWDRQVWRWSHTRGRVLALGGETYQDGMSPLDHFLPWQRRT